MAISYFAGNKLYGLSTDTKPLTFPDGSIFYESDTRKQFIKTGGTWQEMAASSTPVSSLSDFRVAGTSGLGISVAPGNLRNDNVVTLIGSYQNLTASASSHVPTVAGGSYLSYDSTYKKFGSASLNWAPPDNTTDVSLQYPINSDWDWSGDFTVDFWAYWNAINPGPAYDTFWSNGDWTASSTKLSLVVDNGSGVVKLLSNNTTVITGTTNINASPFAFDHIALTRSGSSIRLFINGIQEGSTYTSSDNFSGNQFWIGQSQSATRYCYHGRIDEFRVLAGTAAWTANFSPIVDLLLHLDNSVVDSGPNNFTVTEVGSGVSGTSAQSKFGGYSEWFAGWSGYSGSFLTIPWSAQHNWTGDFTCDCWVNTSDATVDGSYYRAVWANGNATLPSGIELAVLNTGVIIVGTNSGVIITGTTNIADGNWHHIAVTRNGSSIRLFVDGTQEGSTATNSSTFGVSGTIFYIGQAGISPFTDGKWHGYVDEFRTIKDLAAWTSNFTTPSSEYAPLGQPYDATPPLSALLLHFDGNNTDAGTAGSATSFVELNSSGVASLNTSGFSPGRIPLGTVYTASGTVSSITDERAWFEFGSGGASGASGYSGSIGTSGFSGESGIGASGYSGAVGTSGFSGYSGSVGTASIVNSYVYALMGA